MSNDDFIKNVKGFSRLQLEENGEIVADSGWHGPNTVVNLGFQNYICALLCGSAGAYDVNYIGLGTGGTTATDATNLSGEIMGSSQRASVSTSIIASKTCQFAATFASSDSFVTTSYNISNIGLFNQSSQTTDGMLAANTFASSTLATNQNVNVTYQIRFS